VIVQAMLFDDGTIIFSYNVKSNIGQWDSRSTQGIVVGISNGNGVTPSGSQNFTGGDFGIDLTGYEIWCRDDDPQNPANCVQSGLGTNDAFDLDNRSIVFNPDGATGFLVSSSIKDGSGNGGSDVCAEPIVPHAPVAVDDNIVVDEDQNFTSSVSLLANDTDADGDDLKVTPTGTFTTTQGGEIVIQSNGHYTYKSAKNFNGVDSFVYTVKEKNSADLTDEGTLNITVDPVNDAPVANDDSIVTAPNTVFNSVVDLDANDTDVDSITLMVIAGTFLTKEGGSITIAASGSYTYTPPASHSGDDSVEYTVTDGLLQDIGKLNITITTETLDIVKSVYKSVKKLGKNKSIKKDKKSKKFMKKARKHLNKAIEFFEKSEDVNGDLEVENAIADLGKVKKKKGKVKKLIAELESIP